MASDETTGPKGDPIPVPDLAGMAAAAVARIGGGGNAGELSRRPNGLAEARVDLHEIDQWI